MSENTVKNEPTQTISSNLWMRVTIAYLLIPLMLFVCAGDFAWWQAWVYAVLIMTAGIGGRLWAEQWHPGLTAERQSAENLKNAKAWDKVLAPLMAISISYFMVIVAGLDHRYQGSPEFSLWVNVVGFLLITFGYAVASWALAENRFFFSVVRVAADKGHAVCDSGPYRFVRHPGYAGNAIALFGIVLALNSLWALIPVVVSLIITGVRTQLEDRVLQQELPGYQTYAQKVRYRLIPGVY